MELRIKVIASSLAKNLKLYRPWPQRHNKTIHPMQNSIFHRLLNRHSSIE